MSKMTFEEARKELKELAEGEHYAMKFELSEYGTGVEEIVCSVYIHGYSYNTGRTWDKALDAIAEEMGETKKPSIEGLAPKQTI